MRRSVLIVDDDGMVRRALRRQFNAHDFDVDTAASYDEALDSLRDAPADIGLVDVFLSERAPIGVQLIEEAKRIAPQTAIIAISGRATTELTSAAMRAGAVDVLEKPIEVAQVERAFAVWKRSLASLDALKWSHIHSVLGAHHGNKSQAARQLGCSRPGLEKMLHRSPPRR